MVDSLSHCRRPAEGLPRDQTDGDGTHLDFPLLSCAIGSLTYGVSLGHWDRQMLREWTAKLSRTASRAGLGLSSLIEGRTAEEYSTFLSSGPCCKSRRRVELLADLKFHVQSGRTRRCTQSVWSFNYPAAHKSGKSSTSWTRHLLPELEACWCLQCQRESPGWDIFHWYEQE